MEQRKDITKKILLDLYVNQKYSQVECAKILKCNNHTIRKKLIKYNIDIDKNRQSFRRISKLILIELYIDKKFSLEKIGKMFNCSSNLIKRELRRHKIYIRNHSESKKFVESKIVIKKDKLYDLYIIKQYTLKKCGEIFGCCGHTIKDRLKKYGISIRNKKENNKLRMKNSNVQIDKVVDLYINKKYTMNKCSKILKCSRTKIYEYLISKDIFIRSRWAYPKNKETKKKMRLAAIKRIKKQNNNNQICPAYNSDACNFFNYLNDKFDLNGQHAENGREFYIKKLGYFVDYYESDLNLVIEWDEKKHFKNGQLKEKDIQRQKEIENHLGCKFIRIKEDEPINLLEINGAIRRASLQHLF
jgi:predicted HTH domain antitoxin